MQKKLIAEFLGTFVLCMGVVWSVSTGGMVMPTLILAATILGLMVYLVGWLSGCHINPAVTIGLWSVKKIESKEAVSYIMVQLMAGLAVMLLADLGMITVPAVNVGNWSLYAMEFLGMLVFAMGIGMVAAGKVHEAMGGVVVGMALLVGVMLSVMGGAAGILNPAVAVALKAWILPYIIVDILGATAGFQLAHYLTEKKYWWSKN